MRLYAVEGCGKPEEARTYCAKHYVRFRKYGSPEVVHKRGRKVTVGPSKVCMAEGCVGEVRALELCWRHYQRQRRAKQGA